jgi:GNAT superfamily N-acetyltransferase
MPGMTETTNSAPRILELDAAGFERAIPDLAALLVDAVESGAALNFLPGVTGEEAAAWWRERLALVADGTVSAFVAADEGLGRIVGSTLLIRSRNANSPHRAEIAKVIVQRSARRLGLGRALVGAAEARSLADGRWLLVLDTHSGGAAEVFYRSLGWHAAGTIPDYSLRSDGTLGPATFFWKDLRRDQQE